MKALAETSPARGSAPRVPGRRPLRLGPVSTVVRPRSLLMLLAGALALLLVFACDLALGDYPITPIGCCAPCSAAGTPANPS